MFHMQKKSIETQQAKIMERYKEICARMHQKSVRIKVRADGARADMIVCARLVWSSLQRDNSQLGSERTFFFERPGGQVLR